MGKFTLIFLDRQLMQVFEFCPFSYQLGENGERAQRWWSETKKLLIIKTNKKLCFIDIAEPPPPHAPGKCGLTSPHPTPLFCPDMIRVQADELNAERYVHTKT